MAKMMDEFKTFISRGNVMDMAVGVIVGGAFTGIVNSLVGDILMPLIGGITGGIDLSNHVIMIGDSAVCWGNFLQSIINFLIVAWVIFMVVKGINKMKKKEEKPAEPPKPAEPSEDILLLREIRDSLKK